MKRLTSIFAAATLIVFAGALLYAQESSPEKITVRFSDPSKPGLLEAGVYRGAITVKGYEGKEVIIEARVREMKVGVPLPTVLGELVRGKTVAVPNATLKLGSKYQEAEQKKKDKIAGMKKIEASATELSVEEENNVMEVSVESMRQAVDLTIQVPYSTNLKLEAYLGGDIVVENVTGEIEVENYTGSIKVEKVSGVVLASTYSGSVTVSFLKVDPGKPMSFSTYSGDIDVTLPPDVKADLRLKPEHGDIYTDFELKLESRTQRNVEDTREKGGKYRITFEKAMYGSINGGGPEFKFTNYAGDIFIRKAK